MVKFSSGKRKSRFVVVDSAGLKMTRKEFMKASKRFEEHEKMLDKKFKRMRGKK